MELKHEFTEEKDKKAYLEKEISLLREILFRIYFAREKLSFFSKESEVDLIEINFEKLKEKISKLEKYLLSFDRNQMKNEFTFFCQECNKITKHKKHCYLSGPVGLGGGLDWDYCGFQCLDCKNVIYEEMTYELGINHLIE